MASPADDDGDASDPTDVETDDGPGGGGDDTGPPPAPPRSDYGGRFVPGLTPPAGYAPERDERGFPLPATAAVGDLDGDGRVEVVFGGLVGPGGKAPIVELATGAADGHLVDPARLPLLAELEASLPGFASRHDDALRLLALLDLDGDGDVDPVTLGWFRGQHAQQGDGAITSAWLQPEGCDVGLPQADAVGVADLDRDGLLDVFYPEGAARVRACPEQAGRALIVERQVGDGTWEVHTDWATGPTSGVDAYGVTAAELAGGTYVILYGPQGDRSTLTTGELRPVGLREDGYPAFEVVDLTATPSSFEQAAPFPTPTTPPPIGGPAGADGALLISREPMGLRAWARVGGRTDLLISTVWGALNVLTDAPSSGNPDGLARPWQLWDASAERRVVVPALVSPRDPRIAAMTPWGLDRVGHVLVAAHGDDEQFVTTGTGTGLHAVGLHVLDPAGGPAVPLDRDALGLGALGHWRGLCTVDLDGDPRPDLVVTGEWGSLPQLLVNETDLVGEGIALRLAGAVSNALGVGARVEVSTDGAVFFEHVLQVDGSPRCLSHPVAWAPSCDAWGRCHDAVDVTVRWPSGLVTTHPALPVGAWHTLEEPAVVVLDGRTARANGRAERAVRIVPGAVGLSGAPTVRRVAGTGRVASPELQEDGSWLVRVTAPTRPGAAVIEVTLPGQAAPLAIRPRITWTP